MSVIIPADHALAVYTWSLAGDSEPIVVTMGHNIDGASDGQDAANRCFDTWADTDVRAEMPPVYTFEKVVLYAGTGGPDHLVFESDRTPVAGTNATSNYLPQNCAFLVRKNSASAGRRNRGRFYWPGVYEGSVDTKGLIDPTYVATMQDVFDGWFDRLTDEGIFGWSPEPRILHSPGVSIAPPPTIITGFTVENVISTQRKRLRK